VISAPVINSPIVGGSGIITGNFTSESARDLALMLRAGALPAPLEVIEERTVGPDLGADSIEAGKVACMLSMLVVLVFMIVAYGLFGLFANVALLFNVVMQVGALSMLQATLTLPGIAGIVLTIGMSVDANILVYERMREELRAGRMPLNVVEAGFRNAFSAIIDSNLTSLFCAFVLFFLGTGPVKGFGVTFAIGIVTTLFTAILMTKLMMMIWLKYRKPKEIKI
jgi:protein-export membrane protein SecD